ncbi:MAG: hypothetical protein DLM61_17800, partial [Pseudonocardiales bacterium]
MPSGEREIPRQRDTDDHRVMLSGRTRCGGRGARGPGGVSRLITRARHRVYRVLVVVWVWWRAAGRQWVTYWPELAYLSIGARHARSATCRALLTTAGVWRHVVSRAGRAVVAARVARGWCWARVLCPAARLVSVVICS